MSPPIAIVSGAASGVGEVTARNLAAAGDRVVGIDFDWARRPDGIATVSGDVCDPATWDAALAAAAELGGPPSKLVLNAGYLAVGALADLEEAELRRVFEVNVFAVALALRRCVPSMIERGGGSIVGIASVDALMVEQGLAAYCASKGAQLQLIRSVALDHARDGIRANCVCPAAIDTPFFRRHVDAAADPEAFLREKTERHPAGRILQPEDVAAVVEFLLDPRSVGVTGATVTVDGGLTMTFDYQAIGVSAGGGGGQDR